MTATQGNLASLSRYIVGTPRWYASLGFALALAAGTGFIAFDSSFPLDDAWRGVFFLGIPTVAASLLTPSLDRRLGGNLTHDWSSLLALVSELVVIAVITVAGVTTWVLGLTQQFVLDALLVGLAAIFALRLFVIMAVSRQPVYTAILPASVQTGAAAIMLFVYSGTLHYLQFDGPLLETFLARPAQAPIELQYSIYPFDFVLLVVICAIHVTAVWGFITAIDRPWKSSLGVSVLDFVHGFIGHLAEGSDDLEEFFESIGEDAIVPVRVLSFRRPGGEEKARFVLPMIHPGPMGDIGGGNLPLRIAKQTDGLAFPPHATAGHDFNLVTEGEVDIVCDAADRAYQRIEYTDTVTPGMRVSRGDATLTGHAFGDDAFAAATFSPTRADDIAYGVGLSAISEARSDGLEDMMLADAHNCNDGLDGVDLGHVVPGDERSFDLIEGAKGLAERLGDATQDRLRMGIAWDRTPWGPEDGIGPLGIRVAVVEAGNDRTAYILVDGNNMEPGLREKILDATDAVNLAEVLTSDTHIVNTVEAENQVGEAIPDEDLIDVITSLVDDAIDDLEPVEAGMESERARVTVFGNDRTETLASHANAMLPMAAALASAVVFSVLSISALVFLVASGTVL
jgi:putative membrane protein